MLKMLLGAVLSMILMVGVQLSVKDSMNNVGTNVTHTVSDVVDVKQEEEVVKDEEVKPEETKEEETVEEEKEEKVVEQKEEKVVEQKEEVVEDKKEEKGNNYNSNDVAKYYGNNSFSLNYFLPGFGFPYEESNDDIIAALSTTRPYDGDELLGTALEGTFGQFSTSMLQRNDERQEYKIRYTMYFEGEGGAAEKHELTIMANFDLGRYYIDNITMDGVPYNEYEKTNFMSILLNQY